MSITSFFYTQAESEKQVLTTPGISNDSKCQNVINKEDDHIMSINTPKEAAVKFTKNIKKSNQREGPKSLNNRLKKKHRKETSSKSNVDSNKVSFICPI